MNRTLLIALGAVALAVLLFVFVVAPLLFPDTDELDGPVVAAPAGEAQGVDVDGPVDQHEDDLILEDDDLEDVDGMLDPGSIDETFEVFSARDPFQQLVVVAEEPPAASDPDEAPARDEEDGETVAEGGEEPPAREPGDVAGGEEAGDAVDREPPEDASVGGTNVSLVEVFEDDDGEQTVQVLVNDTGYEAVVKQDFAKRFRVLEIDGSCATFLFDDQRFTLCEGESIRK